MAYYHLIEKSFITIFPIFGLAKEYEWMEAALSVSRITPELSLSNSSSINPTHTNLLHYSFYFLILYWKVFKPIENSSVFLSRWILPEVQQVGVIVQDFMIRDLLSCWRLGVLSVEENEQQTFTVLSIVEFEAIWPNLPSIFWNIIIIILIW